MRTRLTWCPTDPAPFESGWSIFTKLMLLNRLSSDELYRHITRKSYSIGCNYSSNWIDFDRFSDLLSIPSEKLKQGFLDRLGFNSAQRSNVRHCPHCLEKGYHNVFFDWIVIEDCPVHHLPLEGCFDCASLLDGKLQRITKRDRSFDTPDAFSGDLYFSRCRHVLFDFDSPSPLSRISDEEKSAFQSFGNDMLAWRRRVKESQHPAQPLADQLDNYQIGHPFQYRLDLLERVAGPIPWRSSTNATPASFISWVQRTKKFVSKRELRDFKELKYKSLSPTFKAVRRHILKHFIKKKHSRCWRELRNFTFDQAQCLSSERACSACVAFAAWYMSIRGFSNIECLRYRHIYSPPARFRSMGETELRSISDHANLWYSHFFLLVDLLEDQSKSIDLQFFFNEHYSHVPSSTYVVDWSHGRFLPNEHSIRIWLMIPNIEILMQKASMRCHGRSSRWPTMFHPNHHQIGKPNRHSMFMIRSDDLPIREQSQSRIDL